MGGEATGPVQVWEPERRVPALSARVCPVPALISLSQTLNKWPSLRKNKKQSEAPRQGQGHFPRLLRGTRKDSPAWRGQRTKAEVSAWRPPYASGPLHIPGQQHQGHGTELRSRPKSGKALRSCVSRNPTRFHLLLTCVDASDNVSFIRTGAIWDPGLLPLLQPEDQIRLGDWVAWPGEKQPAAAGLRWPGPALTARSAIPDMPTGSSLSLPGPALPSPGLRPGKSHIHKSRVLP